MIGVILVFAVAVWGWLGNKIWGIICNRYNLQVSFLIKSLLLAIWVLLPFADHVIGYLYFEKMCSDLPEIKFYGPVKVGAGEFFDRYGNPKWKNNVELAELTRKGKEWGSIFGIEAKDYIVASYPAPIYRRDTRKFDVRDYALLMEWSSLTSPGGWIARVTGLGSNAPYQCPRKGVAPQEKDMIIFGGEK
ncbi:hypothetical protein ACLUTX_13370 [Enterobacterales bacterium AE_CKDN230030158-1A_HGKHYDSX7]